MSNSNGSSGLRILSLDIENFLKIRGRHIDARGRHVICHGPNYVGKSTVLKSIWVAIRGLSAKQFPEPIHHGESKAQIRLDLGEFVIERKITQAGGTLAVIRADGSKVPKPQAFLDALFRELSLDPVAFVRLKPREQLDVVLGIAGVKPPVARVQQITGQRHDPLPGQSAYQYLMDLSEDKRGLYYNRRLEKGREVDQKAKAILEAREQLDAMGGPLKDDERKVSIGETLKEIEALQRKTDARRAVADKAADTRREADAFPGVLKGLRDEKAKLLSEAERVEQQIKELEARRRIINSDVGKLDQRIQAKEKLATEWEADATADEAALAGIHDPGPDIKALREKVQQAEAVNERLAKRHLAAEQLERLAKELERTSGEHSALEKILEAIRHLRAHLLDGVDLGVEGLEVGEDMLIYKGVPFIQASTAEGYRVGVRLAAAAKPGINVLFVDNAESLDEHERAALIEAADETGMQLWMSEVVRGEKGLNIDFEDQEQPELEPAGRPD